MSVERFEQNSKTAALSFFNLNTRFLFGQWYSNSFLFERAFQNDTQQYLSKTLLNSVEIKNIMKILDGLRCEKQFMSVNTCSAICLKM